MSAELIPLLAGIGGKVLDHGAQQNRQDILTQLLNGQTKDYDLGRNITFGNGATGGQSLLGQTMDPTLTDLNRQIQALYGNGTDNPGMFANLQNQNNSAFDPRGLLSTIFGDGNGFDPYGQNTPGLGDAMARFGGMTDPLTENRNVASNLFQSGGQTARGDQGFQNISDLMAGIGSGPGQGWANNSFANGGRGALSSPFESATIQNLNPANNKNLSDASNSADYMLQQGGSNSNMDAGIKAALAKLANGGNTSALNFLSGTGQDVLSKNGLTPTGAAGESAALGVLANGGATHTTNALQGLGMDLASRPSLLPPELAASFARDQASNAYANNVQAAQRNAEARGNGAATGVTNGLQNQSMADYADKGAALESQAMQDVLLKQQSLQLQQAQMGGTFANQGGTLENNRFGTAANTLGSLEGVAANRFGQGGNFIEGANTGVNQNLTTGFNPLTAISGLQSDNVNKAMGLLPAISNAGANAAGIFGGLGIDSGKLDLSNLGLAQNISGANTGHQIDLQSLFNNLNNSQNNYGISGGQLASGFSNDLGNTISQMLQGNFTAANQGQSRTGQFFDQNQRGISNNQNLLNFSGTQQNNANTGAQNLLNMLMQFTQSNGNNANNTRLVGYGAAPTTSPYSQFLGPGLAGLQSLFGSGSGSSTSLPNPANNGGYSGSTNPGGGYNTFHP